MQNFSVDPFQIRVYTTGSVNPSNLCTLSLRLSRYTIPKVFFSINITIGSATTHVRDIITG